VKTQEEYDSEMRYKRGNRFVVERHIRNEYDKTGEGLEDLLIGQEIEIVGYAPNGWLSRGIGYLVAVYGSGLNRPLPRKCLERYCRQIRVD